MVKNYKVYLSGPSKQLKDEGKAWRQGACEWIYENWNTVEAFDPTAFYDYSFRKPDTIKECRELFMHHLRTSDVILVNLDETEYSPGTAYEIGVANELRIPIIGFGSKNMYGWVYDSCNYVAKSMVDALSYIMVNFFYHAK